MADRITITPSELRQAAGVFGQKYEDISGIIQELETQCNNLEGTWTGDSQTQFASLSAEMLKNLREVSDQILPSIQEILTNVAETLEQTDIEIANSLKG